MIFHKLKVLNFLISESGEENPQMKAIKSLVQEMLTEITNLKNKYIK